MIKLVKVNKFFTSSEGKIEIFKDTSIDIEKGVFAAVMGPSGSGKSTLFNLISGLDKPNSGSIEVLGTTFHTFSDDKITKRRGKHISFIFQSFHLLPHLTVAENIELSLQLNNLKRRYTTDEILEKVGLGKRKNAYPFTLSGGEQQRVAIARAFVGQTPILLADEPTGNLDAKSADRIMKLITDLHKDTGTTILMITHDENVAKKAQIQYRLDDLTLHKI